MYRLISIPIFALFIHIQIHLGKSLKLTRVDVPTMVVMDQPFWLNCSYDLENEELYSIKWYHWNAESSINGEFYRWLPNDRPPGQKFESKGIHLDLSKSRYGNVYLSRSDAYTDGSFRCEVSAEAPSFQTVRKEKELYVYSLPREKPTIKGFGSDVSLYGPGDLINVTCHAKASRPPAILSWYINDEPVEPKKFKILPVPQRNNGVQESISQLSFYSERSHYRNGLLKLRCSSNIIQPYRVTSEELVIDENFDYQQSPQSVTESMANDVPIISGYKLNGYRVNDFINLTCVSRAKPAPKLSFIVNDEENQHQLHHYPVFRLSDGLFASKLGLEFRAESETVNGPKRSHHHHYSNGLSSSRANNNVASNRIKKYRIKCEASMEKNIHSSKVEVRLGTSKHSSGLHFAGNAATSITNNLQGLVLTSEWSLIFIAIATTTAIVCPFRL